MFKGQDLGLTVNSPHHCFYFVPRCTLLDRSLMFKRRENKRKKNPHLSPPSLACLSVWSPQRALLAGTELACVQKRLSGVAVDIV